MKYVNAYEVVQCFGGSEEGGWWFDAGTPLASVPFDDSVTTLPMIEEKIAELKKLFEHLDTERPRTSAAGDGVDVCVYVEERVAAAFPTKRPYYE